MFPNVSEADDIYTLIEQGVKQAVDETDFRVDDSPHRFRSTNERAYSILTILGGYYQTIVSAIDWERVTSKSCSQFDQDQIVIDQAEQIVKKMIREEQIEDNIPF